MKTISSLEPDVALEQKMLQGVSRSFALTIPHLPKGLQRTVSIAYLLCRIVDTIEDEEGLSIDQKGSFFNEFVRVANGDLPVEGFSNRLYPLLGDATMPAEKELIKNAPTVLQAFFSFDPAHQAALRRCVETMSAGMLRFQKIRNPHGLANLSHLDNYCYHVAGVVGEMLTELFSLFSDGILKRRKQLLQLAPSFGRGLQMTNILKDIWEDKNRDVCWLPNDVFRRAGFDLKHLSRDCYTPAFADGLGEVIGIAHGHLKNALDYTILIPRRERGIRKFCLWAIGMALRTLQNLNDKPYFKHSSDIKISRNDLRSVILLSNVTLHSDALLRQLFKIAARRLPAADPKNVELAGECSPYDGPAPFSLNPDRKQPASSRIG